VITLWLCAPQKLTPHNGKKKVLPGPLFDLVAIQDLLRTGRLDLANDEHFYIATDDCWSNMKALKWTATGQLKQALLLLKPGAKKKGQGDYINSQWAKDSDSHWHPCDAYGVCINEKGGFVRAQGAPETYIKFSMNEQGCVCLFLISCHPSS
jgi:hypothetical protein